MPVTDLHGHHDRQLHQRDEALVPPSPIGTGIERLTGASVLGGHPLLDLGGVAVLQPPVGVGDVDAVEGVDDAVAPAGGGAVIDGAGPSTASCQPRPMLGRLPWLALDRRSRALRFLVFFDIGERVYGRVRSVRQGVLDGGHERGSSGVTIGPKRVIEPSASTRNFSKFQRMSPSTPSASATAVSSS